MFAVRVLCVCARGAYRAGAVRGVVLVRGVSRSGACAVCGPIASVYSKATQCLSKTLQA